MSGPSNLLPVMVPQRTQGDIYLDQDGSRWRKEAGGLEGWVRVAEQRPPPDATPDACADAAAYRQWPQALVARLLTKGIPIGPALDHADDQLKHLRTGAPPHDVLWAQPFSEGLRIPADLAETLDRMFVETNFTNVDDEWAWKHLFEAAVYDLPPP